MTEIMFSFDTEDYTNPAADDAILVIARILRRHNVRGCFNIVGELAAALEARGRYDIISELRFHEINFHSLRHSWHPNVVEFTDIPDWYEGYRRFQSEEARGAAMVKRIFAKDRLFAAVPPGNSITSQSPYVYTDLGIPVYNGSLFKQTGGRSIFWCNALNLENNCYLDSLLLEEGFAGFEERIPDFKKQERVIFCAHPNITYCTAFWDKLNAESENMVEWGDWKLPELRPLEVRKKFAEDFEKAVLAIINDGDFRIVTNEDILKSAPQRRRIRRDEFSSLIQKMKDTPSFVFTEDQFCYSPAELFEAAVFFLNSKYSGAEFTPRGIKGPLAAPGGITDTVSVTADALLSAAAELRTADAVPAMLSAGDSKIGPFDFLRAAADVIGGKQNAVLTPASQLPDTSDFYHFDDFRLKGTWMHSKDFADRYVTERIRLQSWTIHL